MEWADNDGDKIGDNADEDDDNDNVRDENDAFPKDSTQQTDHNATNAEGYKPVGDIGEALTAEQMKDRAHRRIITLSDKKAQGLNSGDLPNSLNDQMVSTDIACEEYSATEKKWIAKMCRKPLGKLIGITSYVAPEAEVQAADGEWTYLVTISSGAEIEAGDFITNAAGDQNLGSALDNVVASAQGNTDDRTLTIKVKAATEAAARAKITGVELRHSGTKISDTGLAADAALNSVIKEAVTAKAEVLEQKAQLLVEAMDVDQLVRLQAFQAGVDAEKEIYIQPDEINGFKAIGTGIPSQ